MGKPVTNIITAEDIKQASELLQAMEDCPSAEFPALVAEYIATKQRAGKEVSSYVRQAMENYYQDEKNQVSFVMLGPADFIKGNLERTLEYGQLAELNRRALQHPEQPMFALAKAYKKELASQHIVLCNTIYFELSRLEGSILELKETYYSPAFKKVREEENDKRTYQDYVKLYQESFVEEIEKNLLGYRVAEAEGNLATIHALKQLAAKNPTIPMHQLATDFFAQYGLAKVQGDLGPITVVPLVSAVQEAEKQIATAKKQGMSAANLKLLGAEQDGILLDLFHAFETEAQSVMQLKAAQNAYDQLWPQTPNTSQERAQAFATVEQIIEADRLAVSSGGKAMSRVEWTALIELTQNIGITLTRNDVTHQITIADSENRCHVFDEVMFQANVSTRASTTKPARSGK